MTSKYLSETDFRWRNTTFSRQNFPTNILTTNNLNTNCEIPKKHFGKNFRKFSKNIFPEFHNLIWGYSWSKFEHFLNHRKSNLNAHFHGFANYMPSIFHFQEFWWLLFWYFFGKLTYFHKMIDLLKWCKPNNSQRRNFISQLSFKVSALQIYSISLKCLFYCVWFLFK